MSTIKVDTGSALEAGVHGGSALCHGRIGCKIVVMLRKRAATWVVALLILSFGTGCGGKGSGLVRSLDTVLTGIS